jgi:hypothetical protein
MVWFIHHVEEWFESMAEKNNPSEIIEEMDPDNIEVDDITRR